MKSINAVKYMFDVNDKSVRYEEYSNVNKVEGGWIIGDQIVPSNNIGSVRVLNESTLYCILFEDSYKIHEQWVRRSFLDYKNI